MSQGHANKRATSKGHCNKSNVASSSAYASSPAVNIPMPITGFYADLSQPAIGGRPVYGVHDNIVPNDLRVNYINMADRRFDCQQPYWDNKCT